MTDDRMRRRQFIVGLGGAVVASPLAPRAQQPTRIARIGYLSFGSAAATASRVEALRSGLRDLGYEEGKNIVIEFRWAEDLDRLTYWATDLANSNVDVIFATSSTEVEAARNATRTIPILFATHADPVGVGHVASLARPGGNITGSAVLQTKFIGKGLGLLNETAPGVTRIGVLSSSTAPSHRSDLPALEDVAAKLRVQLQLVSVRTVEEFEGAFARMSRDGARAVIVLSTSLTVRGRDAPALLAELALKHRLPSMFGARDNVVAGGLMSYSPNHLALTRRAATYVDRILKGAKPADLPVEQPTKFEMVLNMKTAKALGLTIPTLVLAQADEVIE